MHCNGLLRVMASNICVHALPTNFLILIATILVSARSTCVASQGFVTFAALSLDFAVSVRYLPFARSLRLSTGLLFHHPHPQSSLHTFSSPSQA